MKNGKTKTYKTRNECSKHMAVSCRIIGKCIKEGTPDYKGNYYDNAIQEYEMIEDERIKKIADHYGIKRQMHQLAEECSELAVEASHSARKGTTVKIIEEMADVFIMIEQVIYLAKIDKCDIEDCIDFKLNRQMNRIMEE